MNLTLRRAYTLVEMLIVIAIVALVLSIAVPTYQRQTLKAKEAKLRRDLSMVRGAMERMAADTGCYPILPTDLSLASAPSACYPPQAPNTSWTQTTVSGARWNGPYLESLPALDPQFQGSAAGSKYTTNWIYDATTYGAPYIFRASSSAISTEGSSYTTW